MTQSTSDKGRRLTKIRVDEVSSVGVPANEEEFIVLKSHGGTTMKIQFDDAVSKAMPDDLKAAIKATVQFLSRLMSGGYPEPAQKSAGFNPEALKTSAEAVGAFFQTVAKGDAEYPVETQGYKGATDHVIAADLLTDLVVAKGTPATLQRNVANLIAFLAKATDPEEMDDDEKKKAKEEAAKKAKAAADEEEEKKKAKAAADEEEEKTKKGTKSFEEQLTDVLKAKRFTPARMTELKALYGTLGNLLKEVGALDEEDKKKAAAGADDDEEKKKAKAAADDEEEKAKKAKAKEDEEKAAKAKADKEEEAKKGTAKDEPPAWAAELLKRLDKIEKTRNPSQDGGGSETETVIKAKAGFWGGKFLPGA